MSAASNCRRGSLRVELLAECELAQGAAMVEVCETAEFGSRSLFVAREAWLSFCLWKADFAPGP